MRSGRPTGGSARPWRRRKLRLGRGPQAIRRGPRRRRQDHPRAEFLGGDDDFAHLASLIRATTTRALTSATTSTSRPHALASSPGAMLFYRADRDGNGKVTRDEMDAPLRRRVDSAAARASCRLSDLQDAFPDALDGGLGLRGTGARPSKETLVRGLFRQEIGSLQAGPSSSARACPTSRSRPSTARRRLPCRRRSGRSRSSSSSATSPGRAVPEPGGGERREALSSLQDPQVTFVMVYVREAHPIDGWIMESNDRVGVHLAQPKTYDERVGVARTCSRSLRPGDADAQKQTRSTTPSARSSATAGCRAGST